MWVFCPCSKGGGNFQKSHFPLPPTTFDHCLPNVSVYAMRTRVSSDERWVHSRAKWNVSLKSVFLLNDVLFRCVSWVSYNYVYTFKMIFLFISTISVTLFLFESAVCLISVPGQLFLYFRLMKNWISPSPGTKKSYQRALIKESCKECTLDQCSQGIFENPFLGFLAVTFQLSSPFYWVSLSPDDKASRLISVFWKRTSWPSSSPSLILVWQRPPS